MELNTKYIKCKDVVAQVRKYAHGDASSLSFITLDGEPIMVASVNPPEPLADNEIAIKNWSENEGIEDELIRFGFIPPHPIRFIQSGFVSIPVYIKTTTFTAMED
jgi:hypothetical protein